MKHTSYLGIWCLYNVHTLTLFSFKRDSSPIPGIGPELCDAFVMNRSRVVSLLRLGTKGTMASSLLSLTCSGYEDTWATQWRGPCGQELWPPAKSHVESASLEVVPPALVKLSNDYNPDNMLIATHERPRARTTPTSWATENETGQMWVVLSRYVAGNSLCHRQPMQHLKNNK